MDQPIQLGDSVILRPGEQYEEINLDISGWRGRVVDVDEDGDLLIAWDSQTMRDIPDEAISYWLEEGIDWTCMFVEPEAVLPYETRDDILDCLIVARQRSLDYGLDFDDFTDNPLYDEWIDDWDDDENDDQFDERPAYFDLDQFLYGLEIPTKEHPRIRRALSQGLGNYFHDTDGFYKIGKQPAEHIPEYMNIPYVFGYGALAILEHKQVSEATKLKICHYAIATMEPGKKDGLPYGLITILGYLAKTRNLPLPIFQMAMMAAEYGGVGMFLRSVWYFGTSREGVLDLLGWLAAHPEISQDEKLFWVWRWGFHCEFDPHLVKAAANYWLARPDVPDESKKRLCWAWLNEPDELGALPQTFRMMEAVLSGDRDALTQMLAQVEVTVFDLPPGLATIPTLEQEDAAQLHQMFLNFRRGLLPAPLKRIAIPALVRLGEDPQTLAEFYWDADRDFYLEAIHGGIADMLREFQGQMDTAVLRSLLEKGLGHSRATVRKSYHILAKDLFGHEYLPQALQDSTKLVRSWAMKQLSKSQKNSK